MKREVRNRIRELCRNHSCVERERSSRLIMEQVEAMEPFHRAKIVLAYWSLPEEVATHDWIEKWSQSKTILLPVISGETLILRRFTTSAEMKEARFGVYEPIGMEFTDFSAIDMVVVPGVAFDARGNRLGHGKGFYDRLLPLIRGLKVGVCFDFQLVDQVPVSSHDISMDVVISGGICVQPVR